MAHTCYGEMRQLFETFTRVWGSGGQASLHLHTQDGKSRAILDIQLGPPATPRPGSQDVRGEGPGPTPGPKHHPQPFQQRPRRRGPAARARDAARRQAWLLEKQKAAEPKQPASDINTVTDTETVTADSADKDSHNSSHRVDEVEWISEPLPEDGVVGVRISRRPSDIPQVDGARDKDTEESPDNSELEETIEQEITFKCEDCDYKTTDEIDLMHHAAKFHHQCEQCGETMASKSNLRTHRKRKHCIICGQVVKNCNCAV